MSFRRQRFKDVRWRWHAMIRNIDRRTSLFRTKRLLWYKWNTACTGFGTHWSAPFRKFRKFWLRSQRTISPQLQFRTFPFWRNHIRDVPAIFHLRYATLSRFYISVRPIKSHVVARNLRNFNSQAPLCHGRLAAFRRSLRPQFRISTNY